VLTTTLGWRWIFFLNVPIGVAALLVTITRLSRVNSGEPSRFAWRPMADVYGPKFRTRLRLSHMRINGGTRLLIAIISIAALIWGVASLTSAAPARPRASGPPRLAAAQSGADLGGTGRVIASGSTAVPGPVLCCSGGYPLGLTATGQAAARGTGAAARASAIARAVADARNQASAAASAGGVTLGRVVDMQVSAPYYRYPLPMGAAAGGSAGGSPGATSSGGSGAPAVMCAVGSPCPYPGFGMSVTVTVTWAIG
jgi:hypothetical protein